MSGRDPGPIWTMGLEKTWDVLRSGPEGLADEEARRRLAEAGPNRLPDPKSRSALKLFISQFKSFLSLLLVAAAVLALIVGEKKDAIVVGSVVLFNAILGFIQEHRAEAAVAALRKMLTRTARVRRGRAERVIAAEELVPGDVVLLEAGDRRWPARRCTCARSGRKLTDR